jgi:predicted nucleic acid-binding protein
MFLDTSGLLCFHNADEAGHGKAKNLFKAHRNQLTHSYVLAEFVALTYARKLPKEHAPRFARTLLSHPRVGIVWVDESLHRKGLDLLEDRLDKGYSLCDAISFTLMKDRGISEALTTDRHFEQEGFTRLLGPS